MSDTFKILAEHFSEDTGVKLTVSGTEAKADVVNKEIFLPENISMDMFDTTLATLLHESYHIKHTKGLKSMADCSTVEGMALNVLEDIRIDAKILKKYPNGNNLYANLINYIDEKNAKQGVLPKEVRILRRLIIESYDNTIFDKYVDKTPEVQQFFDDNGPFLESLKKDSIKAKNTKSLMPMSRELCDRIFGKDRPPEQKNLEKELKDLQDENEKDLKEYEKIQMSALGDGDRKKFEKKYYDCSKKQSEINRKLGQLKYEESAKKINSLQDLKKVSFGLENLDKKDLFKVNFQAMSIEEELLDFLRNNQERRLQTDDGKINPLKLSTYFEPNGLFEQRPVDKQEKTRIFFLIDCSGSMADQRKYVYAQEAINSIAEVIDKGISQYSMDLEYAIYGFDDQTHLVKDFEDAFNKDVVARGLRPSGGTAPHETIKHIESIYPEKNNTKEVVFFLTDGDLQDGYEIIQNDLPISKKKWIFIGVCAESQDRVSQEIFGKYNITDSKEIKEVLAKAMEENL